MFPIIRRMFHQISEQTYTFAAHKQFSTHCEDFAVVVKQGNVSITPPMVK